MFKIIAILDSIVDQGRAFKLMHINALGIDKAIPVYVDNISNYQVGDYIDAKRIDILQVIDENGKRAIFPRLIDTCKSDSEELVDLKLQVYGAIQKNKTMPDKLMEIGVNGRKFYRAGVCTHGWGDVYFRIPIFAYGNIAKKLHSLNQGTRALFSMKLYTDNRNDFAYKVTRVENVTE